ncbi:MAG: hypothetical protein ACRDL5_16790 [Solirubrobacteraceae bacterium]
MSLIDKLKAGADEATARARETVQDTQLKHELGQAYGELGRAAYALIEEGGLPQAADSRLSGAVERVRRLEGAPAGSQAPEAPGR